jgi:nucleotide-binding universal stress UspA family protein
MRNPFRSEAEAYRLVLILVGFFAVVIAANEVFGRWAGLAAFVVLAAALLWWLVTTGQRERPAPFAPNRRSGPNERRILVIANETVAGGRLRDTIHERTVGFQEQVLVVTPALNSPLRHWASDEDPARAAANERLRESLARLREAGIDARGEIGDAEPLQAIEDWFRLFGPDEIIISTHPPGRSHWLETNLVERARERFDVPITHVVVDLTAEREEVA